MPVHNAFETGSTNPNSQQKSIVSKTYYEAKHQFRDDIYLNRTLPIALRWPDEQPYRQKEWNKREELIGGMVEVSLENRGLVPVICENLTRMGVPSIKPKKGKLLRRLFQSCHLWPEKGRYYVVHFKEMFLLDGGDVEMTRIDYRTRNTIIGLLECWGLLTVLNPVLIRDDWSTNLKVISFAEKGKWDLVPQRHLGGSAGTCNSNLPSTLV